MRTEIYEFDDLGVSDGDGWQAGSFTGRVEVTVFDEARVERIPMGDRSPAVTYTVRFGLGEVEIEYAIVDKVTRELHRRMKSAPEPLATELRLSLYLSCTEAIEELIEATGDGCRRVA